MTAVVVPVRAFCDQNGRAATEQTHAKTQGLPDDDW